MIHAKGTIEINHPLDQVFEESLLTQHIPDSIGILKLDCPDEVLQLGSQIHANLGIMMLKFNMPAEVSALKVNERLSLRGETNDARFGLGFDFLKTHSETTDVVYSFGLELKSRLARRAEGLYGRRNADALIGSFITRLMYSIEESLDARYDLPLQRPA